MKSRTRYICPENGRTVRCNTCGKKGIVHIKEELVEDGDKIPECTFHGVAMIPQEAA